MNKTFPSVDLMASIIPLQSPGIIYVAGEAVIIDEKSTKLLESDAGVPFDPYYMPSGLDAEQKTVLIETMRHVFSNQSKDVIPIEKVQEAREVEVKSTPFPPCGKYERDLVYRSLMHRKNLLRQSLRKQGVKSNEDLKAELETAASMSLTERLQIEQQQAKSSQTLGTKVDAKHFLNLVGLINEFMASKECIDMGDLAYLDMELDLTDENVEQLVKQFVFFVLQSKTPLKAYVDDASGAVGVIRTLGRNPLGPVRFPEFVTKYRATPGTSIPPIISKILDDTKLDADAMKKEIEKAIEEAKRQCLEDFKTLIKDPAFLRENPTASEVASKIMTDLTELQKKLAGCETSKASLETAKKACETELAALKERIGRLDTEIASLKTISEKVPGLEEALAEAIAAKEGAEGELRNVRGEYDDLDQELEQKNARIGELEAEVAANVRTIETLNARLRELQEAQARTLEEHKAALEAARADEQAKAEAKRAEVQAAHDAETQALTADRDEAVTARELAEETSRGLTASVEEVQAQLAAFKEACAGKDADLAAKVAQLNKITDQLTVAEAGRASTQETLDAANGRIRELEPQLSSLTADLSKASAEVTALTAQLEKSNDLQLINQDLQAKLAAAQAAAATAAAAAAKCEAELKALEGSATSAEASLSSLNGEIAALKVQLSQGTQDKKACEEEKTRLQATIAALTAEKEKLLGERDAAVEELATTKGALSLATAKVGQEEAAKTKALADLKQSGDQLRATREEVSKGLAAKASLEAEKEKIQQAYNDYDTAFGQVQRIAEWIKDPMRRDTTPLAEIEGVTNPGKLETLVTLRQGILDLKESKHFLPIGEISESFDARIHRCIATFFAAYTWQIHMPYLDGTEVGDLVTKEKQLRQIFTLVLTGGSYKEVSGPGDAEQKINGLYSELLKQSGKPGFPDFKNRPDLVLKHVLDLMIKLQGSMQVFFQKTLGPEQPAVEVLLKTEEEKNILKILSTEFARILKSFKVTDTFHDIVTSYFEKRSPDINRGILNVVFSEKSDTILVSEGKKDLYTYPVIFYLFLFVLRDLLNITSGSSSQTLCPLPPLLNKALNPDLVTQ